jgi:hypothetical protein
MVDETPVTLKIGLKISERSEKKITNNHEIIRV